MMPMIIQFLLRVLGGAARIGSSAAVNGTLRFHGLVAKRKLAGLTHQEIRNALAKQGLKESIGRGHFVKELKSRGPAMGIHTLDDLARALNRGTAVRVDPTTIKVVTPNGRGTILLNAQNGRLVSVQNFGVPAVR